MHICRSYGPDKLKLWPLCHLTFKCDLDLQPTWANVSTGTSAFQREQLCHIILKPMHKCRSYGPDKLKLWPFCHMTFKWDLDPQPTWTNVSTGTSSCQGEQLYHIILKSIYKCRSMARTSSIYDRFGIWPSSGTLTCSLSEQMFQMAFLHVKENNCAILFWNPCINVEGMAQTNPDGRTTRSARTYTEMKF